MPTIDWPNAPSFIETQFPVSKLSKESYKERNAKQGQTLTGLGKWWGRKPLVMVRATLLGVLAQRLVRTLCPSCRQPGHLEDQDWEALVAPWKVARPDEVFSAEGCLECRRTGFRGRIGLYESLLVSQELRRHINTTTDLADLRQACYREGMHPLRLAGARKVAAGLTTVQEVLNVAPSADD